MQIIDNAIKDINTARKTIKPTLLVIEFMPNKVSKQKNNNKKIICIDNGKFK